MKTLYVTDLDGTLLNTKSTLSDFTIQTINALVEQGIDFTYATARSLSSASIVAKGLSLSLPVIVYNGTFIRKPDTGEVVACQSFSEEERDTVKSVLESHGVSPFVYTFVGGTERVIWRTDLENAGRQRYLSQRKTDKRFLPVETDEELYAGEIFYYTCIGAQEELQPVYDFLKKDKRYRCTLQQELYRTEYWLEIMPAKASKAHAIQRLKSLLGCDRVVSFGDAINDIPMFEISDEAYAVENAVEELKQAATGIIQGNDADGVAKWLKGHYR